MSGNGYAWQLTEEEKQEILENNQGFSKPFHDLSTERVQDISSLESCRKEKCPGMVRSHNGLYCDICGQSHVISGGQVHLK